MFCFAPSRTSCRGFKRKGISLSEKEVVVVAPLVKRREVVKECRWKESRVVFSMLSSSLKARHTTHRTRKGCEQVVRLRMARPSLQEANADGLDYLRKGDHPRHLPNPHPHPPMDTDRNHVSFFGFSCHGQRGSSFAEVLPTESVKVKVQAHIIILIITALQD